MNTRLITYSICMYFFPIFGVSYKKRRSASCLHQFMHSLEMFGKSSEQVQNFNRQSCMGLHVLSLIFSKGLPELHKPGQAQ